MPIFEIGGERVRKGETRDIALKVSETSMGVPVSVPLRVVRARKSGPTVFVTGAIHGDELNGTGVIRELMFSALELIRGTLLLVPVVNVFGFERHSRYLPDRRDLNRSFPGDPKGSLAFRLANTIFREVVARSNYGIDLHTAPIGRTNFPHVRADLTDPEVSRLAYWFGSEAIVSRKGDDRSLRHVACGSGCRTILFESGEALKIEQGAVAIGVRGVRNVLVELGMLEGAVESPAYQTAIAKSLWVRAQTGGLLRFHVRPGDLVDEGEPLAVCDAFFRQESPVVTAPAAGIVLGMTTLPVVRPGEPICHVGIPDRSLEQIRKEIARRPRSLHRRVQRQMARQIRVEPRRR
ncbi:MAG: succinylglutamate desuccinylase/aspartoacylase family protein [Polyangiaceae bacterium]